MAFLRFTRDKRGYQHYSLVEAVTNRRGKVRQRVLYWFRSPPDIKVGREPFDEDVRRALEAQNPDVIFDWRSILEAPIPSADAEKWRERRRAERAAKQALSASVAGDAGESDEDSSAAGDEPEAREPAPADADAAEASPAAAGAPSDGVRKKRRRRRSKRPVPGPSAEPAAPNGVDDGGDSGDAPESSGE